jgi:hypothetical protein
MITLTLTPALTCALAVASHAGTESVVLVISVDVNVEVAGPGTCSEPTGRDGILDLKTFLKKRFISLMIDVKEKGLSIR